jgi:4-hydroxybenzoate polyprenyltransferase
MVCAAEAEWLDWQLCSWVQLYLSALVTQAFTHALQALQPLLHSFVFFCLQLGIAIVNDFKSIEGDRAMGLQVFPSFTQSFLKVFLPS